MTTSEKFLLGLSVRNAWERRDIFRDAVNSAAMTFFKKNNKSADWSKAHYRDNGFSNRRKEKSVALVKKTYRFYGLHFKMCSNALV